jgi:hypothetical protein
MPQKISQPSAKPTDRSQPRSPSEAPWMIAFFAIITSGVAFFFWQVAQYGLMLH